MALNSDLDTRICLVWTTKRPFRDAPCKSRVFSIMGLDYYFDLTLNSRGLYNLFLHHSYIPCATQVKKREDYVTIFLEAQPQSSIPHDSLSSLTSVASITNPNTNAPVWQFSEKSISDNLVGFASLVQWKFVCFFHLSSATIQIKNKKIHIQQRTEASCSSTYAEKCIQASIETAPDLERLLDDYSNLLEKKIFPDVNLICEDQIRSVHRSILAARSEVFSAMFRNKMLESETGSVHVKDLEVTVLDMLLKYVYSGKIPDLCDDTAAVLYEAGDKYAMDSLKIACSNWMVRNITEDNCITFLNITVDHSDGDFKDKVVKFIYDHPKIFKSDAWSVFSEDSLRQANEIMKGYFEKTTM